MRAAADLGTARAYYRSPLASANTLLRQPPAHVIASHYHCSTSMFGAILLRSRKCRQGRQMPEHNRTLNHG
jgi:hypothetical protein